MIDDDIQALRRQRLAQWLQNHGGAKRACEELGLPISTESHISQIIKGSPLRDRGARNMEKRLEMPDGYLDRLTEEPMIKPLTDFSPEAQAIALRFDAEPVDQIAKSELMTKILSTFFAPKQSAEQTPAPALADPPKTKHVQNPA